jgi:hypothetical protein
MGKRVGGGRARAQNKRMERDWRPIAELRPGCYAVGRLADGGEVDIYRAGEALLNVATGETITGVTGWQPLPVRDRPADFR